jgi:uncharacterized protein YndB with AHSA1/START domain
MPIQITMSEEIAAAPERVFEVMTDIGNAGAWMPNLVRIERLTEGSFGAGTQWREVRKVFGKEAGEVFEVTRSEPPRLLELYVDGTKGSSRKGFYRFRYDLAPASGGTAMTVSGEIGGMGWLGELIGKLLAGTFKKALAKDLQAMKAHIERGGGVRGQER